MRRAVRAIPAAPVVLALLAPGCGSTYERLDAEALARQHPWATVVRLGCLDLGVHLARHPSVPRSFTVVQYELGNRCDRPLRIDLAAVRVRARYPDGVEVALERHDPHREVRPATLELRSRAFEALAYSPSAPHSVEAPVVCLTLGGVVEAEAATPGLVRCLRVPPGDGLPRARGAGG